LDKGNDDLKYTAVNLLVHKLQGISWLAKQILASEEGLCSVEFVRYPCCSRQWEQNHASEDKASYFRVRFEVNTAVTPEVLGCGTV
jgi:hypothetical protein